MSPLPPISLPRFHASVPAGSSEASGEVAIPVRLPGELRRRIGAIAKRTGRTAAELIATGVAEYMCAMEARLTAGIGDASSPTPTRGGPRVFRAPRILAEARAHARAQEKAQARARAQLQAQAPAPTPIPAAKRDPLDRFFERLTPEQELAQTYSGSIGGPGVALSPRPGAPSLSTSRPAPGR